MSAPDVVVVGAGVAGCALAVGLARRGRRVTLLEREAVPGVHFRGEYLQPSAVAALQRLGLGQVVEGPGTSRLDELVFLDIAAWPDRLAGRTTIRYPDGHAARGLPHRTLVTRLRDVARGTDGVTLREGVRVRPDGLEVPRLVVEGGEGDVVLTPRWVVGCDGRGSTARRWIGGPAMQARTAPTWGAEVDLLVGAELQEPPSCPGRVEVVRTPGEGSVWLFGMGPDRQRVYWNIAAATAPRGRDGLEAALQACLDQLVPLMGPLTVRPGTTRAAPAGTGWLGPPARGRVLLAGDAVAVSPPMSGQGMACALLHVEALVDLLTGDASEAAVASAYARIVRDRFRQVERMNLGLVHQFFSRSAAARALGPWVLRGWNADAGLRARVGEWFGGAGGGPLRRREFLRLLGVGPRPAAWGGRGGGADAVQSPAPRMR